MRRNRGRSYTIDAENIEDFNKKCDIALKNEYIDFNNSNNDSIKEVDESQYQQENNDKNTGIITNNNYNFEEIEDDLNDDNLGEDIESENNLTKFDDDFNQDEKNIELLCIYLKQSIAIQAKEQNNLGHENIFYRYKNPLHMLSGNAIYDLNMRELIEDIMTENEFEKDENNKTGENEKKNNLREFISQNIKGDCTLKIMVLSNNDSTRNLYIKKFFSINEENNEKNKDCDNDKIDFEIRKKAIILFNKTISLQIFDTSDEFHNYPSSKIYYQFSTGFFIFIEATNHNSKQFLENIFNKLEKYLSEKTIVIFGINMLFKKDSTIDGFNLKEFALNNNCLYIPIKISDFTLKNALIVNLLNLMLIKKIDNKKDSLRKSSKENKKVSFMKNDLTKKINCLSSKKVNEILYDITKMDISNSLGFKKDYRINHLNAFDTEKKNIFIKKKSRKWSDG